MPDAAGWPTAAEVYQKVAPSAPTPLPAELETDPGIVNSVVAEFQSAPGPQGFGGTGRRFTPITETRLFDGSGYPELFVGDIVPGTPLTVVFWDNSPAPSVVLRQGADGTGSNTLAMTAGGGFVDPWTGCGAVFPRGVQNVSVTATWGFAALVPADVCEAVLCEAASRTLVQYGVPLTGVGEDVKLEDFEINTSSGISVWGQSSPIAVFHSVYINAVKRYRVGNTQQMKALATARRMS